MVCMVPCSRMTSLSRLLNNGVTPEFLRDLSTHEKIALQRLQNELCDADEPNLLGEEDMHVFDCRPLTDPLHLVRCNACKKPIKASQYAVHAGHCKSIHSGNDPCLVPSGGSGKKKPPRKGRKMIKESNGDQGMIAEEKEKHELTNGKDVDCSESNFDNQSGPLAVQPGDVQRIKFQKLMVNREVASRAPTRCYNDAQVRENGLLVKERPILPEAPPPMATKIYYSQGSRYLRLQLSHLYQRASAREVGRDSNCEEKMQDNTRISPQLSHSNKLFSGALTNDKSQGF